MTGEQLLRDGFHGCLCTADFMPQEHLYGHTGRLVSMGEGFAPECKANNEKGFAVLQQCEEMFQSLTSAPHHQGGL